MTRALSSDWPKKIFFVVLTFTSLHFVSQRSPQHPTFRFHHSQPTTSNLQISQLAAYNSQPTTSNFQPFKITNKSHIITFSTHSLTNSIIVPDSTVFHDSHVPRSPFCCGSSPILDGHRPRRPKARWPEPLGRNSQITRGATAPTRFSASA